MSRYTTQETDKAEKLEEWVQKLAEETNKNLDSSELYAIRLIFRNPFEVNGRKYNNGFVSMHIKFISKEPDFLTETDREPWHSRMRELAERKFGIDTKIASELDYVSIPFEEQSEEELYILTSNKESTIRSGFDRIERYIKWYCSAVKDYDNVVQVHTERMKKHLGDLVTLSE